jgi:DNA repair ATPase RecN
MPLEKISRVTYNLKDKDQANIKKVIHQLAAQGKNSKQVEQSIAVMNNPKKIYDQILVEVKNMNKRLTDYINNLNGTELSSDTCKAIRQELATLMANADRLDSRILGNLTDSV